MLGWLLMWEIDRDYITEEGEESRVGVKGESINVGLAPFMPEYQDLPTAPVVRFRMKDDDGIIYYGGWLHSDTDCLNQQAALAYGMNDAGCTTIEIKFGNGKWVQEIG